MLQVSGITYQVGNERILATELDSHADSPMVGSYSTVLEYTGRKANVTGFTEDLRRPMTVPVVNAALAYDCDITGETRILVVCNALYFKNMDVNLIPPFMMRLAGVEVNECPKFLSKNPSEDNHSMYFPREDVRISFHLEGIISYIPTRAPRKDELKELEGKYLLLTPNMPTWDPHTGIYRKVEADIVVGKRNHILKIILQIKYYQK